MDIYSIMRGKINRREALAPLKHPVRLEYLLRGGRDFREGAVPPLFFFSPLPL